MKILFVSPSYKPAYVYGGPAISVSELAEALVANGHSVTVYTTTANGKTELDVPANTEVMLNGVKVFYFRRITGDHTHVSPLLWKKLWQTCRSFDIVNLQSWWSILIIGAAYVCKKKRVPYVISPRGMLSSYSFQALHSFPKKVIHRLIGKGLLKNGLLHATTTLEWQDCEQVHDAWNGFVLPNLINLPSSSITKDKVSNAEVLRLGFLSRIDTKKGIEILFRALSEVSFNFKLLIAGKGEDSYLASLKELASNLRIEHKIEWCGWKGGDDKFNFMQSIDLFVLTSHNENFAIAVTESLAMGTPVLVSNKVGLAEYVMEQDLGWVCKVNADSIKETLERINNDRAKLARINQIAPRIIQIDYQKDVLADKYLMAYQNLLVIS